MLGPELGSALGSTLVVGLELGELEGSQTVSGNELGSSLGGDSVGTALGVCDPVGDDVANFRCCCNLYRGSDSTNC